MSGQDFLCKFQMSVLYNTTLQTFTSPVHLYYDLRDVCYICQWCTTTRCSSLDVIYIHQWQCRCFTIQVNLISCAVHCEKYFTIWRKHIYIGKVHLFSRGTDVQIFRLHFFSCSILSDVNSTSGLHLRNSTRLAVVWIRTKKIAVQGG